MRLDRTELMERVIRGAGGVRRLADGLGITPGSVSAWDRVPAERVIDVERLSGVPRSEIRPDIYPSEAA